MLELHARTYAARAFPKVKVWTFSDKYECVTTKQVLKTWPRFTLWLWGKSHWVHSFDCDKRAFLWYAKANASLTSIYSPLVGVLDYQRDSDHIRHACLTWFDGEQWCFGEEGKEIHLTKQEQISATRLIL